MNKEKVVEYAVKHYKKQQAQGNTGYTEKDAFVFALEVYDTGYDLDQEEWGNLERKVIEECNKG